MRRALFLVALILFTADGLDRLESWIHAQGIPLLYFAETGHTIAGPFLDYFQEQGGAERFGFPITEEIADGERILQYFQKAVLIRSATDPEGAVVTASLGQLLGAQSPPLSESYFAQRYHFPYLYFPETGHTLAFAFREYFQIHGGAEDLGYPISEPFFESGRIVQYFQNARLEWHPQNPLSEKVQLGFLGEEYFAARGLDPVLRAAVEPLTPASTVTTPGFTLGSIVRVQGTGAQGLLLRSGPGLSFASATLISEGTVLQVRGGPQEADGYTWWQVSFEGGTGWVAGDFLATVD